MPPQIPPLDEQTWEAPHLLPGLPGGNLNNTSIFWYFMMSPFCDPASFNSDLSRLLERLPEGQAILYDRSRFEAELRSRYAGMDGFCYMVIDEPKAEGEGWVIQRQRWSSGRHEEEEQDEEEWMVGEDGVVVEGTWYTCGARICMAPSLGEVLQARLLETSTRLNKLLELGRNLVEWTPGKGYQYKALLKQQQQHQQQRKDALGKTSRAGSRLGSPTLAPVADGDLPPASQTQDPATSTALNPSEEFSETLFLSSLALTNRFGTEYMDENPLTGEPGSFVYANTTAHVEARNKKAAAAAAASQKQQPQQSSTQAAASQSQQPTVGITIKPEPPSSTAPSAAPTPKSGNTSASAAAVVAGVGDALNRKGNIAVGGGSGSGSSQKSKEKRRKSKGPPGTTTTSPVTPSGASGAPGGGL